MASDALLALASEQFVLLTTFRRSGDPARTTVWIVRDGDRLLVTTGASSGKVKRLRHTRRVELVASDVRGRVDDGARVVAAEARVDGSSETRAILDEALLAKYGERYRSKIQARGPRGPFASTALVITASREQPRSHSRG